ncbi:hypothetical protein POTOM_037965 [Populus tomentosa]|uniref:Pectinesterase inhibitor domain-containing protein n=1 Tax=Populus tomentosa TaxID=118781 RepID=A0A8X7Z6A3_POPTO|nr:hypothetical protein POTOM_037965 [Populus tomentosa]
MPAQMQRTLLLLPFFLTTLLLYCQPISTVASPNPTFSPSNGTDYIRSGCGATLYPEICYASLARYASAVQNSPGRLARVAIKVSLLRTSHMAAYVSNLSRQSDFGADNRAAAALHDCFSNLGDAVDEIRGAALTDEDTCTDGFEDVGDGEVKTEVCNRAADVKKLTSNALALVNSYAATGTP